MEIKEIDGLYLVYNNGELLYIAKNLPEAEGYILWKNRQDAGNPNDCVYS